MSSLGAGVPIGGGRGLVAVGDASEGVEVIGLGRGVVATVDSCLGKIA